MANKLEALGWITTLALINIVLSVIIMTTTPDVQASYKDDLGASLSTSMAIDLLTGRDGKPYESVGLQSLSSKVNVTSEDASSLKKQQTDENSNIFANLQDIWMGAEYYWTLLVEIVGFGVLATVASTIMLLSLAGSSSLAILWILILTIPLNLTLLYLLIRLIFGESRTG